MSKLNLTSTSNSSTLDLTAYGLTALPPEFLVNDSNTITELILKANSIKKLPLDCFHALKKIQLLDYSMNELFDIPDVIFSLSCLEHLDLSCNSITFIPNTISLLKNLKLLNFVGNSIPSIPFQIGSLPKLNQLFLNINAIISPPPSITNLGDEFILSFLKLLHGCSAQGALLLPPLSIEGWLPEVFTILSNLTKLSVLSNSFFELDFDVCDFSN
jgi:Leucine-rich repeat (LRR) protein